MFSFGWGEIFLVLIVVIVVVGPKDIPKFLRQIGKLSKSFKKISREFKSSLNELADEKDIKEFKNSISDVKNLKKDFDIKKNFNNEINTIKESASLLKKDVSQYRKGLDFSPGDSFDSVRIGLELL